MSIIGDEQCPECRKNGNDTTGNHLMVFSDGNKYCNRCQYKELADSSIKGEADTAKEVRMSSKVSTTEVNSYPSASIRGIPTSFIKRYGIKVSYNEETGEVDKHYYPIYRRKDKEPYTYKVRELPKKFYTIDKTKGERLQLFGQHIFTNKDRRILLVEGECFLPDTEVLTPNGWLQLQEYDGSPVMQVGLDGAGSFEKPTQEVVKDYHGDMVHYKSSVYNSITTPNHNLVRVALDGSWFKAAAKDSKKRRFNIPTTLKSFNSEVGNQEEFSYLNLQVMVMLSADFTFREGGDMYTVFTKDRKIQRAKMLLDLVGIKYSSNIERSSGKRNFYIHRNQNLPWYWKKEFDFNLLSVLDSSQLLVILRELVHWDGNTVPDRDQVEYSSNIFNNVSFVQTLSHLCGFTSTIIPRTNEYGHWYKASILFNKQTYSTQKEPDVFNYKGKVYCLTMPAGCLLVRQQGTISISGNCDAVAAAYMLKKYAVPCVSLPTGANAKAVGDNINFLSQFDDVYLYMDQDEAGSKVLKDILTMLPDAKIVKTDRKDACDMMAAGQDKEFLEAFWNAKGYKPDFAVPISELAEGAVAKVEYGLSYPFPSLTKALYGARMREVTSIGGAPGSGKTIFVQQLLNHLMFQHDAKVAVFSLEEDPTFTLKKFIGSIINKPIHLPDTEYDKEEALDIVSSFSDKLYVYSHHGAYRSWEDIVAAIRYYRSEGVRYFVIDPLSALVAHLSASEGNEYLNQASISMASLAQELEISFYTVSHLNNAKGDKGHDEGAKVRPGQWTGSRGVWRYSHNMIAVQRNQQAEEEEDRHLVTISILKNRLSGNTPSFQLKYDVDTGKLYEPTLTIGGSF